MNTIFRRKNAASRLQTRDERNNFRFCENDRAMQRFSKNEVNIQRHNGVILSEVRKDIVEGSCKRFLSSLVWILSSVFFIACDFHGPWEYYPEEREVYTGIYTYGYVMAHGNPYVCFSKVYQLEETSSQDFAFYDSANVSVSGRFVTGEKFERIDTTAVLEPKSSNPNCFYTPYMFYGISGESYELSASFKWDSAGHAVQSTYKAIATIPNRVTVKGMNVPQQKGGYVWQENRSESNLFYVSFLEYPMDMEFVKAALDYDKTVRGVLSIMNYDIRGGESQNTTMNQMFKGIKDADEEGYRGIAMHDPLENQQNLGFSSNRIVAGIKNLDTLYLMNMMLPIGSISVDLYSTDDAYVDYMEKVKQSVSDSRVVPESNIENGMGVFCGMAKTTINIEVSGDAVGFSHMAWSNCKDTEGDNADSWDSRGCRLYQDVTCSGMSNEDVYLYGLQKANEMVSLLYRDSVYNRNVKTCYASNVKAAMMLDTTKWSQFLPDTINAEEKSKAYDEGLKRYCVANNFKNNNLANCSQLQKDCLERPEKNECKEYLWLWCADRDWNMRNYEQCRSAFVSRYYIEELKSSILKREVEKICDDREAGFLEIHDDGTAKTTHMFRTQICENWCKVEDDQVKCQ